MAALAVCFGACHPAGRPPVVSQAAVSQENFPPGVFARLLLATWTEEQQRLLAGAAEGGLVVFAASGSHVQLLAACRMSGRYQYLGLSPQEQHVTLADDAQVRVNLALDSVSPPPRSPLTLDLVHVGRLATTRRAARGAVLVGACAGATHFARTLSIGETRAGADGVDRRPRCGGASPNDRSPPTQCRRFLRAELVGLRAGTFDTADAGIRFCPSGWALADDVCVRRAPASVYECLDDPAECRVQCDRGSAPSCTRLGYLLAHGEAGFLRDERQALTFYERACSAGYPAACFNIGVLYSSEGDVQKDEALAERYWRRACDDGYAAACSNLGVLQMQGRSRPIDRERAFSYFGRACAGGEPHSCLNAVHIMGEEERAQADPVVGALLTDACDGDVATGCFALSVWLSRHGGGPAATKDLVDKACRLGSREACELSGTAKGI
jgi:hypothetical protein